MEDWEFYCNFNAIGDGAGEIGVPCGFWRVWGRVGVVRRRYRGSGPPPMVVGVSPAAGDKPQPYIRTAALPPARLGDEAGWG